MAPPSASWSINAFDANAPEVRVGIGAVLEGKTDIAMGNAMGSNIFDVLCDLAHPGHQRRLRHKRTTLGPDEPSVLTGAAQSTAQGCTSA